MAELRAVSLVRREGRLPMQSASLPFAGAARLLCLALLATIYAGAAPFLATFSRYGLYALYAALTACLLLLLRLERRPVRAIAPLWPYALWLLSFFLWGTLVSPDQSLVLPQVVRVVVQSALILTTVAFAL